MHRREFIRNTSLSAGLAFTGGYSVLGFRAPAAFQIKMLRNNVGIFTENGGTIGFLLSNEGIVVVDSEFPEPANHLIAELKKQSEKPFNLLINTHHHGDHTSGNIAFKGLVQHVAGHENCIANHKRVTAAQNSADKQLYADISFGKSWKTRVGSEKIRTYYFGPGHTNGDAIIHFQHANTAHMGDLVFNRRYAFIDRSAGASIKNWITVLDKTLKTFDKNTLFIFGHAFDPQKVTGNKDDIRAMQNYLSRLLDFVGAEIKAGKTKDDILKATTIPGVTEWQGDGIQRGLTAAYEELTSGK